MTLEEYFSDWMQVIDKQILLAALQNVAGNSFINPSKKDIFKAFELCPYKDLKVVFLGQDPYPQKGVATGLAFGNNSEPFSPSLGVIMESCIDYTKPHSCVQFDCTLESWAKQGILLLNSALTVHIGRPNSHSAIWRPFITSLLSNISKYNTGIIYVLFGSEAATFIPYIGKFNEIIKMPHPARCARNHEMLPHTLWTDINSRLIGKYGVPIKWYTEY